MFDFHQKLYGRISGMLMRHQPELLDNPEYTDNPGRAVDWLPPVLGPADWSIGMMADRSAAWYLDRGQA